MSERRAWYFTLAATVFLLASTSLALSGSVSGYEISLYQSLPLEFWAAISGAFLLYFYGLSISARTSKPFLTGANLIGLTGISLLLAALPALRYGTYYAQWDVWFHLGDSSRIAASGSVDLALNFYPSLHLLWVSIARLTAIPIFEVGVFIASPLVAFKVPLSYILATRIFRDKLAASFTAALAAIPDGIVGTFPSPWFYSLILLLLLVLVLVLRFSSSVTGTVLLVLILVAAFVISHPLAPVFLILAVILIVLSGKIASRVRKRSESIAHARKLGTPIVILTYLSVLYVAWIALLTLALQGSLQNIIESITTGGVINPISYGRFFTPILLAKVFGAKILVGILFVGGILLLVKGKPNIQPHGPRVLISLVLSSVLMFIVFQNVASGLGFGDLGMRLLSVPTLILPMLAGFFLADIRRLLTNRHVAVIIGFSAVLAPFSLAVSAMYPSPNVALFNYQNTQGVYSSVDWGAAHLPESYPILSNSHVGRYAYYPVQAFGENYAKMFHWQNTIPSPLSQLWSSAVGVIFVLLDEETIQVAEMDLRAWNSPSTEEIKLLNRSPEVARLYDNGGVQIYMFSFTQHS